MADTLRLAVAQNVVPGDPYDPRGLHAAGAEIRRLMGEAAAAGARLVQFPEGSIVYPDKRVVSRSYYIVSDEGELVERYDKRFLSHTEFSHMFAPGSRPLVFEVDGFRFGTALCIEVQFPELFAEYEQLDVDCVLVSTDGVATSPATIVQAYGAVYCCWLGFSVAAQNSTVAASGIVAPGGAWLARCAADGRPGVAVADLDRGATDPQIIVAVQHARPWRRTARAGLYDARIAHGDPRSDLHTAF